MLGQPHQLGAGEVRVEAQPGQLGDPVLVAASRSRSQMSAVRRSCQTIARRGEPSVSRSHSRTVSRWLVMPTACSSVAVVRRERRAGGLQGGLPDLLGGVLDPARLGEVLGELLVALGDDPALARSTTRAVTPVVPASMARTLMRQTVSRRISRIRSSMPLAVGVGAHLVVLGADPGVEVGEPERLHLLVDLALLLLGEEDLLLVGRRGQVEVVEVEQPGQLGDGSGGRRPAGRRRCRRGRRTRRPRGRRAARPTGARGCTPGVVAGRAGRRAGGGRAGVVVGGLPRRLHGDARPPRRPGCCPGWRSRRRSRRRPSRGTRGRCGWPRRPRRRRCRPAGASRPVVVLEQPLQGDRRGGAVVEVGERLALVGDVGVGLGGDGADAGHGGGHGRPTARNLEATATPHDSPSADRATIEKVMRGRRPLAILGGPQDEDGAPPPPFPGTMAGSPSHDSAFRRSGSTDGS